MKNIFTNRVDAYIRLIRADKPIGTLLLLWPALTALCIATAGHPSAKIIFIFILGAFIVRSAGCILNDVIDRKFDRHVARTQHRPLVAGEIGIKHALILAGLLLFIGFILVLFLNTYSLILACIILALTALYPFMKRITYLPQVWLGLTFNCGILMAFAATQNHLGFLAYLLLLISLLFTISYDTFYAMVDRDDDIKIGVKSTAILFGQYDILITSILSGISMLLLIALGFVLQRNAWYFLGLLLASLTILYQHNRALTRNKEIYFKVFLNYNLVWMFIFLGTYLSYLSY